MSTMTVTRPAQTRGPRVTTARVAASEWTKFWSLRSSAVTLGVGVALLVGVGLLATSLADTGGGPGGGGPQGPVDMSLAGAGFAQLAFATLGVLFMAGEYSTGMIRSSLAAVPARLPVLWAKIAVFGSVAFGVSLTAAALAFTGGQLIAGDTGASWSDPGVARAVIGTAVVVTGSGILGVGLGALLRSTPAGISTLFGVMFLLSGIAELLLPDGWADVAQYLPAAAARAFVTVVPEPGALAPWTGLAVFAGYIAATVAAAAWRLKRTDA